MGDAKHLIARLCELYPPPDWVVYSEVRSMTGTSGELRIADAVALNYLVRGDVLELHGFEAKMTRRDWQDELNEPQKSERIAVFCVKWFLVVPAPWKRVVLHLSELPPGWGLIEIGTGAPVVVVDGGERPTVPPSPRFIASMMRKAAQQRPLPSMRPGRCRTSGWQQRRVGGRR